MVPCFVACSSDFLNFIFLLNFYKLFFIEFLIYFSKLWNLEIFPQNHKLLYIIIYPFYYTKVPILGQLFRISAFIFTIIFTIIFFSINLFCIFLYNTIFILLYIFFPLLKKKDKEKRIIIKSIGGISQKT